VHAFMIEYTAPLVGPRIAPQGRASRRAAGSGLYRPSSTTQPRYKFMLHARSCILLAEHSADPATAAVAAAVAAAAEAATAGPVSSLL
jgi:hypothetical protein